MTATPWTTNEVAQAEISPPNKTMGRGARFDLERVAAWGARRKRAGRLSERNLWLASHKLAVAGDKTVVDDRVFYSVLARMRELAA